MKRKQKKQHVPNGEMFEYNGRFYMPMVVDERNPCSLCAFGKPKTHEQANGCAEHVCEFDSGQVFFQEVK